MSIDCELGILLHIIFYLIIITQLKVAANSLKLYTVKVGNNTSDESDAMKRKRKQVEIPFNGLKNQGTTCYLNSVLQVLYMTQDFRETVQGSHSSQQNNGYIDHRLSSVFNALKNKTASTKGITDYLGIKKVNEQHDAAECFEKILSCSSSKASKIFRGELTHNNTCYKCKTGTESISPFWCLPLTLCVTESYCVTDGIQKYFQESEICGENQLYCNGCHKKTDSLIKLKMHQHPGVLTLLLKRFKFDYHHMDHVKLKCKVQIPRTLKIPTTDDKSQLYQLYAYVEHSGELRSGHYVAIIKSQHDDNWYIFNDSNVTKCGYQPFQLDEEERNQNAYLLFYRKTTDPSSADSSDASTSGCSQSNEPCSKDLEKVEMGEGKGAAAMSDCKEERKENQNTVGLKTEVVVGDDRNEMTGTDNECSMSTNKKGQEDKETAEINSDHHIDCSGSQELNSNGQGKDKIRKDSDELKDDKNNLKPAQNNPKSKTEQRRERKDKKRTRTSEAITYVNESKLKRETTTEMSKKLTPESDGDQKTVQRDNDDKKKPQGAIQQNINPGTEGIPVRVDSNLQNDIKVNDGESLLDCTSMVSQNDASEQQGQSNENIENTNESKSLSELNTEKRTQVSPDAHVQNKDGNGPVRKKNNKRKGHNKNKA